MPMASSDDTQHAGGDGKGDESQTKAMLALETAS